MKRVPMLDLSREYAYMKAGIDAAIADCLKNQQWILGPQVRQFEGAIAEYVGAKHCVGASSGTEALVLALRALAIQRTGKEFFGRDAKIITTAFTFTATGDAILRAGATPVFVDIDPVTFNIDVSKLKECVAKEQGIVGIIPVHLYGRACDMDAILKLAADHKLFVVEDVAQAFGASYKGKKLGSLGTVGAFSFFPSKNLGAFGDAGMVSTNDPALADLMRMLTKHGGKDKYNVDHIGYNARLDTIQAAVLLAKLGYLDEFNDKRRAIARQYDAGLKGVAGLTLPVPEKDAASHCYHQYTVRIADGKRDQVQTALKNAGVDTMIYYPVPLHIMKLFKDKSTVFGDLRHSERAAVEVLSLPIEPLSQPDEVSYVVDAFQRSAQ